jgi:putative sigma-54 modulation protein
MIESIEITGTRYEVDETTKKYILKKIGRLDRYLPRHARKTVTADVRLWQINADHGNKYEAEVILNIPDKRITAKDSTVNMLAAIDIIEAKLTTQLRKYKESNIPHVGRRGVLSRFKRSYARESQ